MEFEPQPLGEPENKGKWARHRVLISSLLVVALVSGIGIGLILSGGAFAEQTAPLIKVNHSHPPPDPALSTATALSDAFAQVARMVEPAVVHIETESSQEAKDGDPYEFFRQRHQPRRGSGSGVIVDPAGFILTNHHVIMGTSRTRVKLLDGRAYTPEVIGVDSETDLAVLHVKRDGSFPYALVGDSDRLKVGDWVVAIGSPFGLEQTVTAGIISAKDRVTDGPTSNFQQFLQTDAAINPGNSGGPLINLRGEVVGINTQISTNSGVYNGIGFALPSSMIVNIYNQLVTSGKVRRGFLGILMRPLEPEMARVFEIPEGRGVLIENLSSEDSPAATAGLKSGDVIIEFDGDRVTNPRDLTRKVGASDIGRTIQLKYIRDGKIRAASVRVGLRPPLRPYGSARELPPAQEKSGPSSEGEFPFRKQNLGAKLDPVSSHVASALKLSSARGTLVTDTEDGSLAEGLGLAPGDVITKVNRVEVRDPDHLRTLLGNLRSGDPLVLEVIRPRRLGNTPGHAFLSNTVP